MESFYKNDKWSFPFDKTTHQFEHPKFFEMDKDEKLRSLLLLKKKNFECQQITIDIKGIYSLPDPWKAKIVSIGCN